MDAVVDSVLFLRQLLVVIDLVPIFEVSVGPGGSCHVCLAAPGDSWGREKKEKKTRRERREEQQRPRLANVQNKPLKTISKLYEEH